MRKGRSFAHAALLVGLVWMLAGVAVESSATKDEWESKSAYLLELQEQKEFSQLENRVSLGEQLSDYEKARFDDLSLRFQREQGGLRDRLDWQGGPDAFGYTYVDNQNGDTATYEWIELQGDPQATWLTWTGSHDDNTQVIQLGLTFPFYGQNYTQVRVSTNGNLQFTTSSTSFSNVCLPTTTFAGPVIFPFWDDLHLDHGGQGSSGSNVIAFRNFGDYVVIEYDSIGHCCSAGGSWKFETILYADGRIKMQYSNMVFGSWPNTQTIGIQAASTGPALQYVCNATGHQPLNGLAIWFGLGAAGSISGHVEDDNGAAVSGARVEIDELDMIAYTDGSGNYSFPTVLTGTFDVIASKRGYSTETVEGVVVVEGQNVVVDFVLESSGLVTFSANNLPQPIIDVTDNFYTINVTEPYPIDDIDVLLDLTHTFDGDLYITLTSPEGTVVVLADNRGGGGDNYSQTIFDDEAPIPISQGTPPFSGEFQPETPLSGMDDESTLGTWTLLIDDQIGGDSGQLLQWELYVTPGNANGGHITGTVTNRDNGTPVMNARVELVGEQAVRFTNGSGAFAFSFLDPGTYSIQVSASFFEDETAGGIVVTAGQTTVVDVQLDPFVILYSYSGAPVPIVDNDTSFAVINVPDDFDIEGFYVRIDSILHTWDSDMDIFVRTPSGMQIELSTDNGGSGDNYIGTLLDDAAPTPVTQGVAPFTGTYQPEQPLAPVIGTASEGDWTLVVFDDLGGDVGNIFRWTLLFEGSLGPEGTLTGTVRNLATNQPIQGATVSIPAAGVQTTTNAQGVYEVDVDAGTWNVQFSAQYHCDTTLANITIGDEETITLNAGLRAPLADVSVTSISAIVAQGGVATRPFTITNGGNCALTFVISDTSAWLSAQPATGTIPPGSDREITVTFDAAALPLGEYQSLITVSHNAVGSPVQIPVTMDVGTSADDMAGNLPTEFSLVGNQPNPFNSMTEIVFDVPRSSEVTIVVYNVIGQHVKYLAQGTHDAGRHHVVWSGADDSGRDVGTGLYLVRMEAAGHVFTGKIMLLR